MKINTITGGKAGFTEAIHGARSIKPSDYPEIRMDILDILDA